MARIAFLFSGQGAQYTGMGKELYDNSPAAKALLDQLEKNQPGLLKLCFQGTAEELKLTVNTQPAVYAVDLAAAAATVESGITPVAVAGFSLGELAAVTFSGIMSLADGFGLIQKRAGLMARAAEKNPGAMLAVLRMENEKVEELCSGKALYPVNYNCPGQLVVAGSESDIVYLEQKIKEAAGRSIRLAVSGGFHSPFMDEAAKGLAELTKGMDFKAPAVPVYSNLTGQPYGEDVSDYLSGQINHPVLWEKTIRQMSQDGVDCFIELGPGKVLSGLVSKIIPQAAVYHVETSKDLEIIREELKNVKE
jgi:[acyl-carrier-protein] S-malonyltransferase